MSTDHILVLLLLAQRTLQLSITTGHSPKGSVQAEARMQGRSQVPNLHPSIIVEGISSLTSGAYNAREIFQRWGYWMSEPESRTSQLRDERSKAESSPELVFLFSSRGQDPTSHTHLLYLQYDQTKDAHCWPFNTNFSASPRSPLVVGKNTTK